MSIGLFVDLQEECRLEAIPMGAFWKKRSPAQIVRHWCNETIWVMLNWLTIDQYFFAHQGPSVLGPHRIVCNTAERLSNFQEARVGERWSKSVVASSPMLAASWLAVHVAMLLALRVFVVQLLPLVLISIHCSCDLFGWVFKVCVGSIVGNASATGHSVWLVPLMCKRVPFSFIDYLVDLFMFRC